MPSKKVRPRTATTVRMQVLLTATRFPAQARTSRSCFDPYALVRLSLRDADQRCVQTSGPARHANTAPRAFLKDVQPAVTAHLDGSALH